jgi:hypothetical protein
MRAPLNFYPELRYNKHMWIFKKKKKEQFRQTSITCTFCRSTKTTVITHHGTGQSNYIRAWRGKRYITCRCLDCGQDFYADVPQAEIEREISNDERLIDDEEALRQAEDELKREADEEQNHRF